MTGYLHDKVENSYRICLDYNNMLAVLKNSFSVLTRHIETNKNNDLGMYLCRNYGLQISSHTGNSSVDCGRNNCIDLNLHLRDLIEFIKILSGIITGYTCYPEPECKITSLSSSMMLNNGAKLIIELEII